MLATGAGSTVNWEMADSLPLRAMMSALPGE
jgi:hypothetical protein